MTETSFNTKTRKGIVQLLRSHGITPTAQRVKIAMTMLSEPQHLSAEQVLEKTNRLGRPVSKATVYNSLGLFARKGLIRELLVDPDRAFYDSTTTPHHHFYDPVTEEIYDIEDAHVDITLPETLPQGMEIDGVELVVRLRPTETSK